MKAKHQNTRLILAMLSNPDSGTEFKYCTCATLRRNRHTDILAPDY